MVRTEATRRTVGGLFRHGGARSPRRARPTWQAAGTRIASFAAIALAFVAAPPTAADSALQVVDLTAAPASVYEKLEITFRIVGSLATHVYWPYDPSPPNGVPVATGITVDAVFTDPDGHQYSQPAFHAEQFRDEVREGRDWHLPTGRFRWHVRFAPHRAGTWTFRIVAVDGRGRVETPPHPFTVGPSSARGFVRVSAADTRYFEFDDGSLFTGLGVQVPAHIDNPATAGAGQYGALAANGINFVRVWIGAIFGGSWNTWIGGRNQYGGYLPITGLVPVADDTGRARLALRMDYEPEGDTGWFDACRMQLWWWDEAESIEPGKTYRIRVEYQGEGITGPRVAAQPEYGLVAKIGGWFPNCHEPGTSTRITSYGRNQAGVGFVDGSWHSGGNNYLPRVYLALENVTGGVVSIRSVSLREELIGGGLGPELMSQPSMERETYVPQEKAYSLDKIIEFAERSGVYLKLVVMEKEDDIYRKLDDNGEWTDIDNHDGFYGMGRAINRTRWLQQAWWRYLQARWGYSSAIHSWELANEGDPASTRHYELADEFGKYMHCRVFGVEPGTGDGARCRLAHPNAHLATTSFWHSFPAKEFWANGKYPNVDYADVHAYVSTSYAPVAERQAMQWDAAHFHAWHSRDLSGLAVGKPIVRGEAGLDAIGHQDEHVLGLDRDTAGTWLHNFLWSSLDAGALHEIYWWTSHIWNASFDHRAAYRAVRAFVSDLPLNKGGYVDWGGSVTNPALRVVGQKNPAAGALHLWVQNTAHTWKNVVDGVPIPAVSGDIVVPGFSPGTSYRLERWNTYAPGSIDATETVMADSSGRLTLAIRSLRADLALRIRSGPRAPTGLTVTIR